MRGAKEELLLRFCFLPPSLFLVWRIDEVGRRASVEVVTMYDNFFLSCWLVFFSVEATMNEYRDIQCNAVIRTIFLNIVCVSI